MLDKIQGPVQTGQSPTPTQGKNAVGGQNAFGTMLRRLHIPHEHHHNGNLYNVIAL